jgi:AcrR family transcriptional regulator
MGEPVHDRRVLRSRQALTEAFMALVVEGPYDDITVGDIVERAGVGRSTFYEHYANKDELLRASLADAFGALADTITADHDPDRLKGWMEGFWENRRVGRAMLGGQARVYLVRQLAALIEERLAARKRRGPLRLLAYQIAEAELGLVYAWQCGVAACTPADLANLLHRTALGMADAGLAASDA